MKAAIVTHSSTYEKRAEAIGRFFEKRGDEVTWIFADFDHQKKTTLQRETRDHVYLHMTPYYRNLSLRRLSSIQQFARDAEQLLRLLHPDLICFLVPANSFVPAAERLKAALGCRIVLDLIDLWPESLPLTGVGWLPPIRYWRDLRQKHLNCADVILTECRYYQERIALPQEKTHTLYWYKENQINGIINEEKETGRQKRLETVAAENSVMPVRIAYMGSINHIIDPEKIAAILAETEKRQHVYLEVIGDGEGREHFLSCLKQAGIEYRYHGAIYDEERKNAILSSCAFGLNIMKTRVNVGLTMKSIDYLYCGLPLINNIPGDTWELIDEGQFGINVQEDNLAAAADAICAHAGDGSMRLAAREAWQRYFSREAFDASLTSAMRTLEENVI